MFEWHASKGMKMSCGVVVLVKGEEAKVANEINRFGGCKMTTFHHTKWRLEFWTI